MKKSLLLFLLFNIYFFTPNFAQIEKGNIFINANIGININENDFDNENSVTTVWAPKAGYFVQDRVLIGTGIGLSTTKNGDFKNSTFSISPFFRYYFSNIERLKPYGQIDLHYNQIKSNFSFGSASNSFTDVFLRTGFNYFISENVALNVNAAFRINKSFNSLPLNQNDFTLYIGNQGRLNLSLGFNFFLNNNKDGKGKETEPLVSRYLKAGNQIVSFSGTGVVVDGGQYLLAATAWRKFTKDHIRWSHNFNAFLTNNVIDDGFVGLFFYQPTFEPYFNISGNAYFVPSVGIITGAANDFDSDSEIFLGGTVSPKLTYFFNNALMDMGMEVRTPIANFGDNKWTGTVSLAGEFFIQNNLSLRGQVNVNAFGGQSVLVLSNFVLTETIPKTTFTIGFNYFFNKGKKSTEDTE